MNEGARDAKQAEAMIAATLALMTSFAESRCAAGAARICAHLLQLSANRALPWELRTVMAKLGARWSQLRESAAESGEPGEQSRLH
jgi:hypothetical protein